MVAHATAGAGSLISNAVTPGEVRRSRRTAISTSGAQQAAALDKLGLRDRARAIAFADESGLITPGDAQALGDISGARWC